MTLTRAQKSKLPKANLLNVRWWSTRGIVAKFRLANAMAIHIGRLEVSWRMPWLERSARALHPELFHEDRAMSPCERELVDALKAFLNVAAHCEIKSGVCGCGEDMGSHSDPYSAGHSPTDMADQVVSKAIADAEAAIAKAEGRS